MKIYYKEISKCSECPRCYICLAFDRCKEVDRTIYNINDIPDWCPLENKY